MLTSAIQVGPEYVALTETVATYIASEKWGIVYGGTDYGMMKILAACYKRRGGRDLVGVMAEYLMKATKGYKAYEGLDESYTLTTVPERIEKIMELSDGFLVLPGGYGTLEELGVIVGSKANKFSNKPIVMYNFKGYYDSYLSFLNHMTDLHFSKISPAEIIKVTDNIEEVIDYFKSYAASSIPDKFVD